MNKTLLNYLINGVLLLALTVCAGLFTSKSNTSAKEFYGDYAVNNLPKAPEGKQWSIVNHMTDEFEDGEFDTTKWQREPEGNGWGWIGRSPRLVQG